MFFDFVVLFFNFIIMGFGDGVGLLYKKYLIIKINFEKGINIFIFIIIY